MSRQVKIITILFLFICVVKGDYYDTYTGVRIPRRRFEELKNLSLVPWCAIEVPTCDPLAVRRMDLSCNSLLYPPRGAQPTPYSRMLPPDFNNGKPRTAASGRPLPAPRPLRVDLMSDGRVASKRFTQMVVNIAVFNTGDTTSVHDTVSYVAVITNCCQPSQANDPRCAPLEVRDDDLHLRYSAVRCLNLTTPITFQDLGCVGNDEPPSRINAVAPMLELSSVYGNEGNNAAKGRLWEGGELRAETIRGKEWPPSGNPVCVNNEPPNETRCHDSPSGGSNTLFGINLVFIWWFRQHNYLARRLRALNPCWDDDRLYYTAREINIAYSNQIFYYEFLPEIMGRDFLIKNKIIFETSGHIDDYDPMLEPRLSIDYVTATRWFHTIQEGRLKLYDPKGVLYDEKNIVDFTLRTGALPVNNTLAGLTQGAFRQPGAAADATVDPDMGERVLGRLQFASDVISSDIMKGRLLGLPSYSSYRRVCRLPVPTSFKDLRSWMEQEQVDALSRHYESVDDIDVMAGIIAERGEVLVPPTLACIMADQLRNLHNEARKSYKLDVGYDGRDAYQRERVQVDALSRHYESVDDIDVMAGIIAERGEVLVPPTLACIMADQLRRWRRADRFWYEHTSHPQAFSEEQLREIRKMTTAALLCQHGDSVTEIQKNVFLLPKFGSDIVSCSDIVYPDLNVFKDHTCELKTEKENGRQIIDDLYYSTTPLLKQRTKKLATQSKKDLLPKPQEKRKGKRRETTTAPSKGSQNANTAFQRFWSIINGA